MEPLPATLEPRALRRALGRFATGVTIITCLDEEGRTIGLTANSFTSVSLDPLLALVCVERDSRFHGAVLAAGTWAVSFLPEGQEATARWFATRGRPLAGQFDRVPTRRAATSDRRWLIPPLAAALCDCRSVFDSPGSARSDATGTPATAHRRASSVAKWALASFERP